MSTQQDIPTDHNYDGIQEYDNYMPRWWLTTLWLSIFFGIGYWGYYQTFTVGNSSAERYRIEQEAYDAKMAALAAERGEWTDARIEKLTDDATAVAAGQEVFKMNCAACHGQQGEGLIGPNLTDDEWLHGGSPMEIFASVKDGWLEKGMPAWGTMIGEEKVSQVAAYIMTMPPAQK